MSKQSGFTLIEIMVVVVIIGILAAIVAPAVVGHIDKAQVLAAKADLRTFEGSLKMYRVDNFSYPSTEAGLMALIERPVDAKVSRWNNAGYLDERELPNDPWGGQYQYLNPGPDGSDFYVYTFGADGQPGGEGIEADISTSDL